MTTYPQLDARLPIDHASIVGFIAGPYGCAKWADRSGFEARYTWLAEHLASAPTLPPYPDHAAAVEAVWRALVGAASSGVDGDTVITLSAGVDSTAIAAAAVAADVGTAAITWRFVEPPDADESRWATMTAAHLGLPLVEIDIEAATMLPEEGVTTLRSSPLANIFQGAWDQTARVAVDMGRPAIASGVGGEHLFMISGNPAADLLGSGRPIRALSELRRIRRWAWPSSIRSDLVGPLVSPLPLIRRRRARRLHPPQWLAERHAPMWRDLQMRGVTPTRRPVQAERIAGLTDGMIEWTTQHDDLVFAPFGARAVEPLLTPELIDVALRVPPWMLVGGGRDKRILRDALRGRVPDEIVELPKFSPSPAGRMAVRARREPLLALTQSMRLAEAGYVDERRLHEYVRAFMDGEHGSMDFWNTLTLEDWLRRWH